MYCMFDGMGKLKLIYLNVDIFDKLQFALNYRYDLETFISFPCGEKCYLTTIIISQ